MSITCSDGEYNLEQVSTILSTNAQAVLQEYFNTKEQTLNVLQYFEQKELLNLQAFDKPLDSFVFFINATHSFLVPFLNGCSSAGLIIMDNVATKHFIEFINGVPL